MTARTSRRYAQIAAVKKLIGCDANTALISAVFPEPWKDEYADNATVKRALLTKLTALYNIADHLPDTGRNETFSRVMREFPRQSTKPKKRKARK